MPTAHPERSFKEIRRKADLYWEEKKIVFEVQFSPMHPIEARERVRDYASIGINVVWILHENIFNPVVLLPFQQFLQYFPHYYTNMDPHLGGSFYDVKVNGHNVEKREIRIDRPLKNKRWWYPKGLVHRKYWKIHFEGDYLGLRT